MSNKEFTTFTRVELEFMQIIWELEEATTEDIRIRLEKSGRNLTDGGIRTILSVLMRKGHLRRNKRGRSYGNGNKRQRARS